MTAFRRPSVQIAPGVSAPMATLAAQETCRQAPRAYPVEILLEPVTKGGVAESSPGPEQASINAPPDVLFPTAHTLYLIDQAQAGVPFVVRQVFDGTTVDDATTISAVIGPTLKPGEEGPDDHPIKSPLLDRPSWRMSPRLLPGREQVRGAGLRTGHASDG